MRFRSAITLAAFILIASDLKGFAQTLAETNLELARRATETLNAFHEKTPLDRESSRKLHVAYWTPLDREPANDYVARLSRVLKHIQHFYADQMEANGFGRRTIGLDLRDNGDVRIHLVKGRGNTSEYGKASGSKIRQECLPVLRRAGLQAERETLVIFCNLGFWDEKARRMSHESPYYAGGNNASGTAWQLDEPIMDTRRLTDTEMMFDGEYGRISMGKHNSIFIGGVAHELGHALSLPHNKERPDERVALGTALMGSGNRTYGDEVRSEGKGSFLSFASALRLASHPQFSGSTRAMNRRVSAAFEDLAFESTEKGFRVSARVLSDTPVYGVVAYTDPAGGGDYNATTQCAVPDGAGQFSIDCAALVSGKEGELRLVACHVNGKVSTKRYGYRVANDGKVDLSNVITRLRLSPFVSAIRQGNERSARSIAQRLQDRERKIADRILRAKFGSPPNGKPSEVADILSTVGLTDVRPSDAKVGWIGPVYDMLPDENVLITVGNRVFERGIYAHAPAKHRFELSQKWRRFVGQVGLASGHPGSVVFVVSLDGTELWRSKLIQEGRLAAFDLDVAQGTELELSVENGGNGNGADWGVWLDPQLKR